MAKIGQIFHHRTSNLRYKRDSFFDTNDAIGIEFELENVNNEIAHEVGGFFDYWKISDEPSLRNGGIEYCMTSEMWGKDLASALDVMEEFLKRSRKKEYIDITSRCSVHIHVDVRSLTVEQLRNFMLVSMAVEPLLFHVSGNRRDNIYCLPQHDVYGGDCFIHDVAQTEGDTVKFNLTEKYASINTLSLKHFGSLEFRHHEGTVDVNRIRNWVKSLINIKNYSMTLDEPIQNFPFFISSRGFTEFVEDVFSDQAGPYLYPGFHVDLIEGVRATQAGIYLDKIQGVDAKIRESKEGIGSLFKEYIISNENKFIVEGDAG